MAIFKNRDGKLSHNSNRGRFEYFDTGSIEIHCHLSLLPANINVLCAVVAKKVSCALKSFLTDFSYLCRW